MNRESSRHILHERYGNLVVELNAGISLTTETTRTALTKKITTGSILTVVKETRMKYIVNHYYCEQMM